MLRKRKKLKYETGGVYNPYKPEGGFMGGQGGALVSQGVGQGLTQLADSVVPGAGKLIGISQGITRGEMGLIDSLSPESKTAVGSAAYNAYQKDIHTGVANILRNTASIPGIGQLTGPLAAGLDYFNRKNKSVDSVAGYAYGGNVDEDSNPNDADDQPLSSNSTLIQGNPNVTDGNQYGNIALDHNEVVKDNFVFSNKLYNPLTGKTFADEAKRIEKSTGRVERRLEENPHDMISRNTAKQNGALSAALRNIQETLATQLGLRNPNGTTKQSFAYGGPTDPPYFTTPGGVYPYGNTLPEVVINAKSSKAPLGFPYNLQQYTLPSQNEPQYPNPAIQRYESVPTGHTDINGNKVEDSPNLGITRYPQSTPTGHTDINGLREGQTLPSTIRRPRQLRSQGVITPPDKTEPAPLTPPSPSTMTAPLDSTIVRRPDGSYVDLAGKQGAGKVTPFDPVWSGKPGTFMETREDRTFDPTKYQIGNVPRSVNDADEKNYLESGWSLGDSLQLAETLGRFRGLAKGPEVEPLYQDRTNISRNYYRPDQQLLDNSNSYNQAIRGIDTNSANTFNSLQANLLGSKFKADNQIRGNVDQMNRGAALDYESRMSNKNRYNIDQSRVTNDLNARNRAAYEASIQNAMAGLGDFGRGLNEKEAQDQMLNLYAAMYPKVAKNLEDYQSRNRLFRFRRRK